MTLHRLRIFVAVAEHLHFSRAAQAMHMTQSAVSTQVKLLEEELNTNLFDRMGKQTHLTEAGRVLQIHAQRILGEVRQAHQAIEALEGLERGHIALGASTTPGTYILPQALGMFRQCYPAIEVSYHVSDSESIVEDILRNQVDFGIVGGPVHQSKLLQECWLVDELIAVACPDHPLTQNGEIPLSALQHDVLVLRSQGSATRQIVETEFETRGLELDVRMELRDPESVKQMVVAGWGCTICSKHSVRCELDSGRLVRLNVRELPFQRELMIVSHRDKQLSAVASALLTILRDYAVKG